MYKRQALCGVCILSAALLYQDYVTVPRKNRELVEALKTCFPEELPPGGGSLGQKEEQAGRETEVSAVDLRSLQSLSLIHIFRQADAEIRAEDEKTKR